MNKTYGNIRELQGELQNAKHNNLKPKLDQLQLEFGALLNEIKGDK